MESRQRTAEPARKIVKPIAVHTPSAVQGETILVTRQPAGQAAVPLSTSPELQQKAAAAYRGYEALVDRTIDVFGDELAASRWLSMPTPDLNGATPIEAAGTLRYDPVEVRKLFDPIFIRIEHGIDV